MRETRLGLDQFHDLIDKDPRNTMIWAPRQSGKTYSLVMKFLQTPRSMFLTCNAGMRACVQDICYELGAPDRRREVYEINRAAHSVRGRTVDAIFIDEIDFMQHDVLDEVLASLYPTLATTPEPGRLIAMSTPSGVRADNLYERMFHSEYTLTADGVTDWRKPKIINHFEQEQELFKI